MTVFGSICTRPPSIGHSFATQYFTISRLPFCAAALIVLSIPLTLFLLSRPLEQLEFIRLSNLSQKYVSSPPTRPQRFILPRNFQSRYRRHLSHSKPLFQITRARRSLHQLSRLRIHLVKEFEIRPVEFTHHMLLHDIATRAAIQQRLSEQTP